MDEQSKNSHESASTNMINPVTNMINLVGHGAHLYAIAAGTTAGGLWYLKKKYHQRATNKFFHSLLSTSKSELSKINYSVLSRRQFFVGTHKVPAMRLNLHAELKSVALVGDNRCGKTIFLSNFILNDMFPWWYRYFFPPRGLFLTGSQNFANINDWLKNQIATTEKEDPWSAVMDLVGQRRDEQWVRQYLHMLFKTKLPDFLKPQPAIIVVDQTEELLRAYRAEFLMGFYNLAKKGRDTDLFRLVVVINTENAVNALKLMNGGNMFTIIQAPKVSREAVVDAYGERFAEVFDDCDSCIGIALDYTEDRDRPNNMTAKEYAAAKKEMYTKDNCLVDAITRDEYTKAGEHVKH
jgi:hypothetical protein